MSDNGSTDGSREYIRERYGGRATVIENNANLGFAAAVNRAFAVTSSDYAFLLNPDAELKDGALASIVAFMDAHPRCGIAGSRIYNYDGTRARVVRRIRYVDGRVLAFERVGRICRRSGRSPTAPACAAFRTANRIASTLRSGAALAIRRAMMHEIGVFDEQFFLYHEEVDYAKRAADAGWESWYVPASEAVHEGMGSAKGQYNVETRKQTSRRKYWIKHHGYPWYVVARRPRSSDATCSTSALVIGTVAIVRALVKKK